MNRSMTKMIDVARHAGVSLKTVSRVLNNEPHVQLALREKVKEAVRELGYVPSASARSLRSNRTYSIHLFSHSLRSNFVNSVQFGALHTCQVAGYRMVVTMLDQAKTVGIKELRAWFETLVNSGKPDGVILVPPMSNDPEISKVMSEMNIPVIRIGPNDIEDGGGTVTIDDHAAAVEATQHLLELGHRRIAFVRGKEDQDSTHVRFRGFSEALEEAGVSVDPDLVLPGLFDFESGLAAGDRLLSYPEGKRPSAVFAANDHMAAGVLVAAHKAGVQVPDDLSIIGFDDSEIAETMWPALTTVRQPLYEFGSVAMEMLIQNSGKNTRIEGERKVLPYALVWRQSTGPFQG